MVCVCEMLGTPADQCGERQCCYATGMLVLLVIVCPHRRIENNRNNQDEADHHCVTASLWDTVQIVLN